MGSRGSGFTTSGGENTDEILRLLQEAENRYRNIGHWSEIFDAQEFRDEVAKQTGVYLNVETDGTVKVNAYSKNISKDVKQLINEINKTGKLTK